MSMNFAADTGASDGHRQRMDSMYRVQRHFYDVTRAYYLLGRNERISALNPPAAGSVLEIGCGTGRNLIEIARRHADCMVYGLDISDEMLVSAAKATARAGLRHRVCLAQGDAATFDGKAFAKPHYDRVLFSYTLSMIPAWQDSLQTAAARLAPGGELHVVDFGPCTGLPLLAKNSLYAWLRQFHVTPRGQLFATVERIARAGRLTMETAYTHRGYAQHAVLRMAL
ncbi:MAG: class I SAM-dependent methyltransferase [Hyphomicrobiales bacterium]